jgi:drug/metabolite transporter (DMT)-like permease
LFGLAWLTRAGAGSPDVVGAGLMAVAGFSWGIYSIRGRRSGSPVKATARNFTASVPLAIVASLLTLPNAHITPKGVLLAMVSGSVTSGLGYVAWYAALPSLSATLAAIVQLAVPPLVATLGILFLGESLTSRFLASAPMILGGIAIAASGSRREARPERPLRTAPDAADPTLPTASRYE